jgi:hypothetical protein
MSQGAMQNIIQQGAMHNTSQQGAMQNIMQQGAVHNTSQQGAMQQPDMHIQQLFNQNIAILKQLDEQQKSINFLIKELKNTRNDLANFQVNEIKVVNEEAEAKVVNEEIEVVNEEIEVVNEEIEVVNEEIRQQIDEINETNEEIEVVNEEFKQEKNEEIEVELIVEMFRNDETKAFAAYEKSKIQIEHIQETQEVKQFKDQKNQKDQRVCYFNTTFNIEKRNIKDCVDNIKDGFNKSYNKNDNYVMLKTNNKNIFIIAYNDNEKFHDVLVSDYWTSKNIQSIDINIKTAIIDALKSTIHTLKIKNPEGQKIVVCYIENQGSEDKYNFIRLYASNRDFKADFKLDPKVNYNLLV